MDEDEINGLFERIDMNIRSAKTYFADNDHRGVLLCLDEARDDMEKIKDQIEENPDGL